MLRGLDCGGLTPPWILHTTTKCRLRQAFAITQETKAVSSHRSPKKRFALEHSSHTPMKIPRWLIISMFGFNVLAAMAAVAWWWVSWPERTAREFARLLAAGQWKEARRMLADPDDHVVCMVVGEGHGRSAWQESTLSTQSRTFSEIVACRQDFPLETGPDGFAAGRINWFSAHKHKVARRAPPIENDLDWGTSF